MLGHLPPSSRERSLARRNDGSSGRTIRQFQRAVRMAAGQQPPGSKVVVATGIESRPSDHPVRSGVGLDRRKSARRTARRRSNRCRGPVRANVFHRSKAMFGQGCRDAVNFDRGAARSPGILVSFANDESYDHNHFLFRHRICQDSGHPSQSDLPPLESVEIFDESAIMLPTSTEQDPTVSPTASTPLTIEDSGTEGEQRLSRTHDRLINFFRADVQKRRNDVRE